MKYLTAMPLDFRLKLVVGAIVSFLGLTAINAAAESSPSPEWAKQYQRAEWVSRVRIESVGSLINPSLSGAKVVAIQGYRYNASVVDGWKGEQGGRIRFRVDISDCHRQLAVDREYIVFGSTNHRGGLQSYSCDDLVSVDQAASLPGFLDQYSQSSRRLAGEAKG
ncbi:hypothetical protein F6455_05865 [Proteobacteria bacterium 005FR1]|nr:hypothetical protein [Proteobacteria bacterium 005FR1]